MSFGDQRKPLRRSEFKRKAPVNTARKPRPPVKRQATRRVSEEAEYRKLRVRLLKLDEPRVMVPCVAGPKLAAVGILGCTGVATELHHLRKRGAAGALANPANVVTVCHTCNTVSIENYPIRAQEVGLVIREGHPLWDGLSARAWRKAL